MPRIRHGEDRKQLMRQAAVEAAARALGQSEAGPKVSVTVLVWDDDKPPRYPAVGLHPGAIEGTVPHLQRRMDHWKGRS